MQNVCGVFEPSYHPRTHPGTQTMNFAEPSGKRGHRSSPRVRKQTKGDNRVWKTQTLPMVHCCPHAPEVTNLNAVASNLLRTYFKS